jgi:prepilin-type N-terminal cleavage/methylation domain-containing protein
MKGLKLSGEKGFTLIEIAIVMVIIGLLAGGGVSLMSMLSERRIRNESVAYLDEAKNAVINYAKINGRLPLADTDNNGLEDSSASPGTLPYLTLGMKPRDANSRFIRYALNTNLDTNRDTSCSALRTGLAGSPLVVDSDGSATAFPVAAVLVSAGQKDADNDGNALDRITAGTYRGNNTTGTPNYLRHPPTSTFDDLVVYISGYSIYGEMCGDPKLTINNANSTNSVYLYNITQSNDIGVIPPGNAISYRIVSGDRIALCASTGGCGTTVTSNPATPLIISGSGIAINVP